MAVVEAAKEIKADLCRRAAKLWEVPVEQVVFEHGQVKPVGEAAGKAKPMTVADMAKMAGKTGGPIGGYGRINAQGAAPSFGTHLVDLLVDPEPGRVIILRYTVAQDAGFLDYRMPVASDLPMIDPILVEVPNPRHPYGVRGVGETPIVPPMAAVANAIEQATGLRFTELPISPPKLLKALKERAAAATA